MISWNQTSKIKANYFNSFVASKSTTSVNSSTIPNWAKHVSTPRLYSFYFTDEVILKIVTTLNINKTHEHDDI